MNLLFTLLTAFSNHAASGTSSSEARLCFSCCYLNHELAVLEASGGGRLSLFFNDLAGLLFVSLEASGGTKRKMEASGGSKYNQHIVALRQMTIIHRNMLRALDWNHQVAVRKWKHQVAFTPTHGSSHTCAESERLPLEDFGVERSQNKICAPRLACVRW